MLQPIHPTVQRLCAALILIVFAVGWQSAVAVGSTMLFGQGARPPGKVVDGRRTIGWRRGDPVG